MSRDFYINGETLVKVKGMGALSDPDLDPETAKVWELGLADKGIRVSPKFVHKNIHITEFGPDVPVETLWMVSEVTIEMTLINFDSDVLSRCIRESMGGATEEGEFGAAGLPMGGGVDSFEVNHHYISLGLTSPVLEEPWRFPYSLLTQDPFEWPLGTKASAVDLVWRAIPYKKLTIPEFFPSTIGPNGIIISGIMPNWNTSGVSFSGYQFRVPDSSSVGTVLWDRIGEDT